MEKDSSYIDPSCDVAHKFNSLSVSEKLTILFDMIYNISVHVTYMSNMTRSHPDNTPRDYTPELETE